MVVGMGMKCVCVAAVLLLGVLRLSAEEKLAATPPMGWNSWTRMG